MPLARCGCLRDVLLKSSASLHPKTPPVFSFRQPAAIPVIGKSKMSNTTIAAKIQAAQQNYNALRDALTELSRQEEFDDDEAKRYRELPAQIEAAKADLETHRRTERILLEDGGGDPPAAPRAADGEILAPARSDPPLKTADTSRIPAVPRKKLEAGDHWFRRPGMGQGAGGARADIGRTLRDMYPT